MGWLIGRDGDSEAGGVEEGDGLKDGEAVFGGRGEGRRGGMGFITTHK